MQNHSKEDMKKICTEFCCQRRLSKIDQITNYCKCGKLYCKDHISNHECTFKYKENHQRNICESLQKIEIAKVTRV
jgi:hypothetical protein